jgi:hypothetical protein
MDKPSEQSRSAVEYFVNGDNIEEIIGLLKPHPTIPCSTCDGGKDCYYFNHSTHKIASIGEGIKPPFLSFIVCIECLRLNIISPLTRVEVITLPDGNVVAKRHEGKLCFITPKQDFTRPCIRVDKW